MRLKAFMLLAMMATTVVAFASDGEDAEMEYTVNIATDEALGAFLVDGEGMTLYTFASDVPGNRTSACSGECAERWPAFFAQEILVPPELNKTEFQGFERDDGSIQTTYRGWPLYYYFEDEAPGDAKGQGLGDVWFVASL